MGNQRSWIDDSVSEKSPYCVKGIDMLKFPTALPSVICTLIVGGMIGLRAVIGFCADGAPIKKQAANSQHPGTSSVATVSGHIMNEAGALMAGVRIRIAVPATDMRYVDLPQNVRLFETTTDPHGGYRVSLLGTHKRTAVSIDASAPGYSRSAGTFMSGSGGTVVEVDAGSDVEANFEMERALYIAGVVVDENGNSVPRVQLTAHLISERADGGVERTSSRRNGTFELFNYPLESIVFDTESARGLVAFTHADYVGTEIGDIYALKETDRTTLRIVLKRGYRVAGTLLDVARRPVPDAMIVGICDDGTHRKATLTDADGRFELRGLARGPTTIKARAAHIRQHAQARLTVDADKVALVLRCEPCPPVLKKYRVLGLELADVTGELADVYDLEDRARVVVLSSRGGTQRLNIVAPLGEGCDLRMVGGVRITSVRGFIDEVLSQTANQSGERRIVQVVYGLRTLAFDGTNTGLLALTTADRAELRMALQRITSADRERIAALQKTGAQLQFRNAKLSTTSDEVVDDQEVTAVILGERWGGAYADILKACEISTLERLYIVGNGRFTDKTVSEIRHARPGLIVERLPQVRLGVEAEARVKKNRFQVAVVFPGSPAFRSGFRKGDVVLEFAGKAIPDFETFRRLTFTLHSGQKVSARLQRGNESVIVTVELGAWD
jgi:PDZ domain/Carboxypeptidase regulatory-like domain